MMQLVDHPLRPDQVQLQQATRDLLNGLPVGQRMGGLNELFHSLGYQNQWSPSYPLAGGQPYPVQPWIDQLLSPGWDTTPAMQAYQQQIGNFSTQKSTWDTENAAAANAARQAWDAAAPQRQADADAAAWFNWMNAGNSGGGGM
jgi:hypothetical protein